MFKLNGIDLSEYILNTNLDLYGEFNKIGIDLNKELTRNNIKLFAIRCNKVNNLYYGNNGKGSHQIELDYYDDFYFFFSHEEAQQVLHRYKHNNHHISINNDSCYYPVQIDNIIKLNPNDITQIYNLALSMIKNAINARKYYVIQLNEKLHKYMSHSHNINSFKNRNNISVFQSFLDRNNIIYFKSLDMANKAKQLYIHSGILTSKDYEKYVKPIEVETLLELPENLTEVTIEMQSLYNNSISTVTGYVETTTFNEWLNKHK